MSLRNVIYTGTGIVGLGLGFLQYEYMAVNEQRYIGEFLDSQTQLTPTTMQDAKAYAADRNSFNGVYSALSVFAGVWAVANGTIMTPRKRENTSETA